MRAAPAASTHKFAPGAHTEPLVTDKTTTSRDVSLGVRWNQADIRPAHAL